MSLVVNLPHAQWFSFGTDMTPMVEHSKVCETIVLSAMNFVREDYGDARGITELRISYNEPDEYGNSFFVTVIYDEHNHCTSMGGKVTEPGPNPRFRWMVYAD